MKSERTPFPFFINPDRVIFSSWLSSCPKRQTLVDEPRLVPKRINSWRLDFSRQNENIFWLVVYNSTNGHFLIIWESIALVSAQARFSLGKAGARLPLPLHRCERQPLRSLLTLCARGRPPPRWKALDRAGKTVRNLRIAEATEFDITLSKDGQVELFRTKLKVSFKNEEK